MKNNFYYKGIYIPYDNFKINQIARVCDKINDCQQIVVSEGNLRNKEYSIIAKAQIVNKTYLFCEVINNNCIFGIYNYSQGKFTGINCDTFAKMDDSLYNDISYELSKIAKLYKLNIIDTPYRESEKIILQWEQYKQEMNLSKDNISCTKDVKFVNSPYEKEINTPQELKTAIKRADKKQKSNDWER